MLYTHFMFQSEDGFIFSPALRKTKPKAPQVIKGGKYHRDTCPDLGSESTNGHLKTSQQQMGSQGRQPTHREAAQQKLSNLTKMLFL